jgi:hypothetical protein
MAVRVTNTFARVLLWTPRLLGILVCLFLGLFALDAFSEGKPVLQALTDFAIHLLPVAVLVAVVMASWRWEWLGAFVSIALAVVYATVFTNRIDWILVISGPLLVVGALFLWSWLGRARTRARA